jgi:hypothetical protein
MKANEEMNFQQRTIEHSPNIGLIEDSVVSFAINHISGEMLIASQDKLRVYSLLNNSLLADYNIPCYSVQLDQKRVVYKVKSIVPLIFNSGWLITTTLKKQLIYFSKFLMVSKPIDIEEQPECLIVNQREEVTMISIRTFIS